MGINVVGDDSQVSTSESVKRTSLALECVDHVHGSDCLPLGMFSVGDSVPDDVLQKHLQHTPGLLVDQARNPLHTTTTGEAPDGRLGDPLDVVTENLPVPLRASLA